MEQVDSLKKPEILNNKISLKNAKEKSTDKNETKRFVSDKNERIGSGENEKNKEPLIHKILKNYEEELNKSEHQFQLLKNQKDKVPKLKIKSKFNNIYTENSEIKQENPQLSFKAISKNLEQESSSRIHQFIPIQNKSN